MKGPLTPQHPVPPRVFNQGHDSDLSRRAYYRWPNDYRVRDAHLDALTSTGSLVAEWVRLIAGRRDDGTYSRTPESAITLDGLSLGIDHRWSKYLPDRLATIAHQFPGVAAWAWGREGAVRLRHPAFITAYLTDQFNRESEPVWRRGMHRQKEWPLHWPVWEWLIAGWYEIARHPAVLRLWIEGTCKKLKSAFSLAREEGWPPTDELLALIARAMNSYGAAGFKRQVRDYRAEHAELRTSHPQALIRAFYDDPGEYDQPRRDDRIVRDFGEDLATLEDLDADALDWSAPVVRFDGSVPRWVSEDIDLNIGGAG